MIFELSSPAPEEEEIVNSIIITILLNITFLIRQAQRQYQPYFWDYAPVAVMVPSLYQTIYAFLLLVMARKTEQMSHLNKTQSLCPPCSDQEIITLCVPAPSLGKEKNMSEPNKSRPSHILPRALTRIYSRINHRICCRWISWFGVLGGGHSVYIRSHVSPLQSLHRMYL